MSQLMLINPRKRRKARKGGGRTAAQKAATKRMVAANRARRGGSTRTRVAKRRSNPIGLGRVARRKSSRVARRRNPIGNLLGGGKIMSMAMPALHGAGGALLVNTALNYATFLPAALKTGNGKYLTRVAAAIALGTLGGKVVSQKVATNMAVGAMTVALHDLLLGIASTAAPSLLLGDVGDWDNGVSEYTDYSGGVGGSVYDQSPNVGEYVSM